MPSAAGILFVHDGHVLLLKRTGSPHPDTWAFPGGAIEDGETPEQAARRETREECGYTYDGPLAPLWTTADGFQCFGAVAVDAWQPQLNDEHSQSQWAPFDALPAPLHPSLAEGVAMLPQRKTEHANDAAIRTAFDCLTQLANDCMFR